ncbi:hypothetical protein [Streptomyces sp. NPDC060243]|uniref:hypothetical protein n=1 Tax=Streptomyces sp. NPDC060243 TaxID=3347081 RepID=UPI00365B4F6A
MTKETYAEMGEDDETIPGAAGSIQQRITEVIENEVPATYAHLAVQRAVEAIDDWREHARDRARAEAQKMLGGVLPGMTGSNMANETADRLLAAVFEPDRSGE